MCCNNPGASTRDRPIFDLVQLNASAHRPANHLFMDHSQHFFTYATAVPRRVRLPRLVLVPFDVVPDAEDREAGRAVRQPRCLHLEAGNPI